MKIGRVLVLVTGCFAMSCKKSGIDHEGWMRISDAKRESAQSYDYMNGRSITKDGDRTTFWMETVYPDTSSGLQVLLQNVEVDCWSRKFRIVKIVGADAQGKVLTDKDDVTPLIALVSGSPISVAAKYVCEREDSGLVPIQGMPLADAETKMREES